MHDLKLAFRRLRRRPGRAGATALALGIGIGATTAAFTAVDHVLLRGLPVERPHELVVIRHENPQRGSLEIPLRPRSFDTVLRGVQSLSAVAGFSAWGTAPAFADAPGGGQILEQVRVAGDYFGVLGAGPALGRLLDDADDDVGATPAAVLSYDAWSNRYGADTGVVGSTILLEGVSTTIVGVAPEGLDFPLGTDVWVPYRVDYANDDTPYEMHILGRMALGATTSAVASDVSAALARGPAEERALWASAVPVVRGFEEAVVGAVRPILRAAMAAALLLLAASVTNAALFLLAGGRAAAHDLALRRALGAPAPRVVWPLAADAAMVGLLAAFIGVALAWAALRFLQPVAPQDIPRLDLVALDGRGVVFAGAAALASAALTVAAAAHVLLRLEPATVLSAGGRGLVGGDAPLRRAAAATQVALTVVSAVAAMLLIRTVANLNRIDPGLSTSDMTAVSLRTPYAWFAVPEAYLATLEQIVRDLEARPGISAVRPTLGPPLQQRLEVVLAAEGQRAEERAGNPYVAVDAVLPGHLGALGIDLLVGRGITDADNRPEAEPVVVVDEVLARALWPGEDPLGKRVTGFTRDETWFRVVGVAAGTRYRQLLEPHPRAYYPLRRLGNSPPAALLVRAERGTPVFDLVRASFERLDPRVRVIDARPMPEVLRQPTVGRRFAAAVLVSFAVAILVLAALGVYGAFTVSVHERVREMGVRQALGAGRADIVRLVLGGIARVAGVGTATGTVVALLAGRLVESLLFEVAPTDAVTFASVAVLSLVVALAAGVPPALRASSTEPAVALQAE